MILKKLIADGVVNHTGMYYILIRIKISGSRGRRLIRPI